MKGFSNHWKIGIAAALCLLGAASGAWANGYSTYYVDAVNGNDANDGGSWAAAKQTIQNAVDNIDGIPGRLVLVTNGVYDLGGAVTPGYALTNRVMVNKPIIVRSVNGPEVTIIKGAPGSNGSNDTDSIRGVYLANGASLVGFTITSGYSLNAGDDTYDKTAGGLWMTAGCIAGNLCILNCQAAGNGGGSYLYQGGELNNCLLCGNEADDGGGVFLSSGGTANNCTLSGNTANGGGGALVFGGTLNNSIASGNSANFAANNILNAGGTIRFTCAPDGITDGVDGCTTNDPLFVHSTGGNYHLQPASPCVNTGDNTYAPTNVSPYDLAGNARISFDVVDMGAYELPFITAPSSGPLAGGNTISITNGATLGTITNVLLGAPISGSAAIVDSGPNWFTITLPAATHAGMVDIIVQTSDHGDFTLINAYTYNSAGVIGWTEYGPAGWTNLGSGVNDLVYDVAHDGTNLYAGGWFYEAGGVEANSVAMWDAASGTWTNLGSGLSTRPEALVYDGTDLYAGGWFGEAGGVPASRVAKWDTASRTWTNLGSGVNLPVYALAHDGTNLYAGGTFTTAGGEPASYVAKWDPALGAWTNLGSGVNQSVLALLHDGVNLYAGGTFTTAGGVEANRVAMWDTAAGAWTNLGSGMDSAVFALAHDGTNLYAGGFFTNAGGVSADYVAKWDAASGAWTNLGSGVNDVVIALLHDGRNLYAGGWFTNAGGVEANGVAMWDAASGAWTNLGSGVNNSPYGLAHDGMNLYAGGEFTTAGGLTVNRVAKWGPDIIAISGVEPNSGSWTGGYPVVISGSNLCNGADITNVTLCGISAASINSQSATQVVIVAGASGSALLGDVRVFSTSYGETVKSNAFTYYVPGFQVLGTNGAAITSGDAAQVANGTKFPPLLPGASWTNTFSITNNGTGMLSISGFGNVNPRFEITGIPASVEVGGVSNFTVKFAPTGVGTYNDWLTISNDSPTAAFVVRLYGPCYWISTNAGPFSGGNPITIANGYFGDITNVLVGGMAATLVESSGSIFTFVMPAATNAGTVDIIVQTSDNGDILIANAYTYNPAGWIADPELVRGGPYIAAGRAHSLGVKSDGTIVAWGWNNGGQTDVPAPNTNFVAVSAGRVHSLGLKSDGTIAAWGNNGDGQTNVPSPNADFVSVAAGYYHSLGLKSDGTIVAWGADWSGQTTVPSPNTNFVAMAGGFYHSLGLKSDGTIVGWGGNDDGQTDVPLPNTNFVAVSALADHSLGLKSDGTIVAWGANEYGQSDVPLPNANFVAVAAGSYHSLGLKSNGTIVAWGWNDDGQTNVPAPNADFGMFTYGVWPSSGSWTGGYPVIISGSNLCNGADVTNVTLCGVSAASIVSQSATQVVIVAGVSSAGLLGDVRVFSTSHGETVKINTFEYLRETQAPLVFTPTTPQSYLTTNALTVSGGSGTGAVSYAVFSGPGTIVAGANLAVTSSSGTIEIRATKAQDDLYFEAVATGNVEAAKADQALSAFLPTNGSVFLITDTVGLSASVPSGLEISFMPSSGIGLINDRTNLSFTGQGQLAVVAWQAGNENWNPAPDVTNIYTVLEYAEVTIASSHGSTLPVTGVYTMLVGTVFTNQVQTPDTQGTTQYVCTSWVTTENLDPAGGGGTQAVVTVNGDGTLTWLWNTEFYLTPAAGPHGTIDRIAGWFTNGAVVDINATPDQYFHFTNWTGSVLSYDNPLSLLMDEAKWVTANFAANWTTNKPTPEWWLAQYGITDRFEEAVLEDPDGDWILTGDEFIMNTIPTNGASFLGLDEMTPVYGTNCIAQIWTNDVPPFDIHTQLTCDVVGYLMVWPCATDRVYGVQFNGSLPAPGWTPLVGMSNLWPSGTELVITNLFDGAQRQFFRLDVQLPALPPGPE